ncbi:hypothetical protein KCP69_08145 [Salmonella enterica subsp. enterica]|nr:hypothetical protein KCP69_08145 [Salmonella enterica subsp. enterica]
MVVTYDPKDWEGDVVNRWLLARRHRAWRNFRSGFITAAGYAPYRFYPPAVNAFFCL